jgi:hypothetical protein
VNEAPTRLYFAYGSNLHPLRLGARAPSARLVGRAALPGHALRFNKLGADGSGKCNAVATGRPRDEVLGVVYALAEAEVAELDRAEGEGLGYARARLEVRGDQGWLPVFTYLALPAAVAEDRPPFHWYKALVLCGAELHGFPAHYLRTIAGIASVVDPDPERAARCHALLERMHCSD